MGITINSMDNAVVAGANGMDQIEESQRFYPLDRLFATSSQFSLASGLMVVTVWRQPFTKNVNRIETCTRGTAAGATPTLNKMALFGFDVNWSAETFTATRLALTTHDAAIWAGTFTIYEKAFSSSETITLERGKIYGAAALCVTGAAAPVLYGSANSGAPLARFLSPSFSISGQTDIPTSFTQATSGITAGAASIAYYGLRNA